MEDGVFGGYLKATGTVFLMSALRTHESRIQTSLVLCSSEKYLFVSGSRLLCKIATNLSVKGI